MLWLLLGEVARGRERIAAQPLNLDRPQLLCPRRDPRLRRAFPVHEYRKRGECREDANGEDGHHPNEIE